MMDKLSEFITKYFYLLMIIKFLFLNDYYNFFFICFLLSVFIVDRHHAFLS
jgi:hypothetical protein